MMASEPHGVRLRLPQVQLSTYGDSLGKNLTELREFIDNNLQGESPA